MPAYVRTAVRWLVQRKAKAVLASVRDEYPNDQAYRDDRNALQEFLCDYFSDVGCQKELGKSISPMGGTKRGGKILKVRWARPGQGKSGALRMIIVAYCESCEVRIAMAYLRAVDPPDVDVDEATADL